MEARDGAQGKTGSRAKTGQLRPADLGRARPLGRETDQDRSDTRRRQSSADLLPGVTLPTAGTAFARNRRSTQWLRKHLGGVPHERRAVRLHSEIATRPRFRFKKRPLRLRLECWRSCGYPSDRQWPAPTCRRGGVQRPLPSGTEDLMPVVDKSGARQRDTIPQKPVTAGAIVSGITAQTQAGGALGRLRRSANGCSAEWPH
jgi:hypothetical protein